MERSDRARRRLSIIAVIVAALFIPAVAGMANDKFTDVPNNNQFHNDIKALAESGVTQGCTATTYCPDSNVTRGQMAAFLNRANALGAGKFPVGVAKPDSAAYCAIADREPGSFPAGPCRGTTHKVDTNNVAQFSWVAIAPDGLPSIVYRNNFGTGLLFMHCLTADCSRFSGPEEWDTGASEYISMAYGLDGLPIIAYEDANNDVVAAHCEDAMCVDVTKTTVDSDGTNEFGDHTVIAIGSDGLPAIFSLDVGNDDIRFVHCSEDDCSTFAAPQVISTSANMGSGGWMAIGSDGYPVFTYDDGATQTLYLTHCANVLCTSSVTNTVYEGTNLQKHSVAIGSDGYPVVAFEGDLDSIVVVHCKNVTCSSKDGPVTIDDSTNFSSPVVVTGLDGFPKIVYTESSSSDQWFADCHTLTCSDLDTVKTTEFGHHESGVPGFAIGIDGRAVISYEDASQGGMNVTRPLV